jgi:hypothetical protein
VVVPRAYRPCVSDSGTSVQGRSTAAAVVVGRAAASFGPVPPLEAYYVDGCVR